MLRLILLRIHRGGRWDGLGMQHVQNHGLKTSGGKKTYDGVLSVDGSTKLKETDAKIWTG
jgi:hypothetical protein